MNASPPIGGGKPKELELWSNRWVIHPLSRRVAVLLAPTPVTPNMVSGLGVVAAGLAAAVYAGPLWGGPGWPWSVLGGFLCHAGWHVLDGADGELARRTGRSSASGEVVDGICDYAGQTFLYCGLALVLSQTIGGWAWALALLSGIARAVQANSYESRRRGYQFWAYGGGWIRQSLASASPEAPTGLLATLGLLYLAISDKVARVNGPLEKALREALTQGGDEALQARAAYRAGQAKALRAARPLSANARTIALGLSMTAGSPLYFFAYEIVGLSLVLAWSLWVQADADAVSARALVQAST